MKDEMPPAWMWHLDDELELWFEEVDRKREEKYGGASEERDEVPMMRNEMARGRR